MDREVEEQVQKEQLKALHRRARQAVTLEEQHEIQEKIQRRERQQRRQRTETERLFTIGWVVA